MSSRLARRTYIVGIYILKKNTKHKTKQQSKLVKHVTPPFVTTELEMKLYPHLNGGGES